MVHKSYQIVGRVFFYTRMTIWDHKSQGEHIDGIESGC